MEANSSWIYLLKSILEDGHEVRPRKMLCKELVCHTSEINMKYPFVTCPDRDIGYQFMAAEAWWILTGQNRVKTIKKYGNIAMFSDDGYHFDGAYGPRVVDQLRYVAEALNMDRDTRQSVMSIWRPNPRHSRDIPCTLTLQWLIRSGQVDCVANMRSSDVWLGWPYDVFNFSMITAYIMLLMREAQLFPVYNLGTLYMNVGSQHLYEKNREAAEMITKQDYWGDMSPVFSHLSYSSPNHLISKLEEIKDTEKGALGI